MESGDVPDASWDGCGCQEGRANSPEGLLGRPGSFFGSPREVQGHSGDAFWTLFGRLFNVNSRLFSSPLFSSRLVLTKSEENQVFLCFHVLAKVLNHMVFIEWERSRPFSLSLSSPLVGASENTPKMGPKLV